MARRERMTTTMEKALHLIRTQEVTYRYRPLRGSINRRVPVTARDLAPVPSHGLKWQSVAALERRGLITLSPHSQNHGRVLPADTEEDQ